MKANPGGNLDPKNVYGRDTLIAQLWDRLESQSILINAERRSGKTQILLKMRAEPKPGWRPVYRDLESRHAAQEFAEQVYDDVQQFLGTATRAVNFIRKFFEESETDYVNIRARTWKELLSSAIEDLAKHQTEERLVFFWDEVPYMLESIRRAEGEQQAAEVLDTLRSLRMEQRRFRVIFTGSIGLHHVLKRLSAARIPSSPVNDMFPVTVPPLDTEAARNLAAALLAGEEIEGPDGEAAAAAIAEEVGRCPFYIHHVVAGLKTEQLTATVENIRDFVARQLRDAADPWNLAHYRERISSSYAEDDDAEMVRCLLDFLALSDAPAVAVDELVRKTAAGSTRAGERDDLVRLLKLLEADHYLRRDPEGRYGIRSPLIKRWWRVDRGYK